MLLIHARQSNDGAILECQGAIVSGEETALLCAAVHNENRDLTIDLTQVESIDVAGIGALISLQAAGTYLKLLNPTEAVRRVLKVTQLDTIFEVSDDREPGLAATGGLSGVSSALASSSA